MFPKNKRTSLVASNQLHRMPFMCNKKFAKNPDQYFCIQPYYIGTILKWEMRGGGHKIKLTSQRKSLVILVENAAMFS